jgi:hypothetical protein
MYLAIQEVTACNHTFKWYNEIFILVSLEITILVLHKFFITSLRHFHRLHLHK